MEEILIKIFENMFDNGVVKDKQKYKNLAKELYDFLCKN